MKSKGYVLVDGIIYIKKGQALAVSSVDPYDDQIIDFDDVAASMFLLLIEGKKSTTQVIDEILKNYSTSREQVKSDLDELISFLVEKKIIQEET